MIEIIPNWHPILVHFTVALLVILVIYALIKQGEVTRTISPKGTA